MRLPRPGALSRSAGPAADEDATVDGDAALAEDGSADEPTERPRPPWSVVVVALGLAVLGLLGALAALLVDGASGTGPGTRADALEAARERTVALTSYDHARLDQDFAEVLETATGSFEDEYRKTTDELRETFTANQAVASATVLGAGIEVYDEDRAVVIVAVDQVIRTATAPPRTERNRLRMTLVRPDDTWLVTDVQRL